MSFLIGFLAAVGALTIVSVLTLTVITLVVFLRGDNLGPWG